MFLFHISRGEEASIPVCQPSILVTPSLYIWTGAGWMSDSSLGKQKDKEWARGPHLTGGLVPEPSIQIVMLANTMPGIGQRCHEKSNAAFCPRSTSNMMPSLGEKVGKSKIP